MSFKYKVYSEALKEKYGEKVYKLPINLPLTCPNRDGTKGTGGCIFCGETAAGFESLPCNMSIKSQLERKMDYIGSRYGAKKFIAFFQNFTNTYTDTETFRKNIYETAIANIVETCVSTRPDCISEKYLDILKEFSAETGINVSLELGLQSSNENTLKIINRGHGLKEFENAVKLVHSYGFPVCAHVIIDLPWDTDDDVIKTAKILSKLKVEGVKMHSLYVVKGTKLAEMYESGEVTLLSKDDYVRRAILFLKYLDKNCAIERIIGRAPEKDTLTANFNISWWKIKEEIEYEMEKQAISQGDCSSLMTKSLN